MYCQSRIQLALTAISSVLVEKPITPTAAEADDLVQLAKSRNLILTVYQNRRWDSDFLTVQKLLASGRVRSSSAPVPMAD